MPGRSEFTRAVGGDQNDAVSMSQAGAFETNNYTVGESISVGDGTNTYPFTVDPNSTIEELILFATGDGIVLDLVSASGVAINDVKLKGSLPALNHLSMDSVTFKDPGGTGAVTTGLWVGE